MPACIQWKRRTGISEVFVVIGEKLAVGGGFGLVDEVLVFEDFELDHFRRECCVRFGFGVI